MAERDRQFQAVLIQHLADSQKADSERLSAVEQEHTLAVTRQRVEQADRWKAEKAEREHQARLKAIPTGHFNQWPKVLMFEDDICRAGRFLSMLGLNTWLVPLLHPQVNPSIASQPN